MLKSYLKSQTPPNNPVDDWLLRSASQLESFIGNPSDKIVGVLGINKAGDLQYIIMPTIVPEALGVASVVLGNSTDTSSKPAFVYLNMSDLGYTSVIETHALIPREICPEEHLPTKYLKSITWETTKVPLGLTCIPIVARQSSSLCPLSKPASMIRILRRNLLYFHQHISHGLS